MNSLARIADPIRVSGFPAGDPRESIGACFGAFLRRVVPSHTAYGLARAACEDIVVALTKALPGENVVAGSVGKRTALAPVANVDLLYLIRQSADGARASDAVKQIATTLAPQFPGIALGPSGVIVPRGLHTVRVVPSFLHKGAFLIPGAATLSRASGWSVSNPVAEAATLRLSDSLYGGRPRLLLTALKAWRLAQNVPVASFALELLVQDFYASAPRAFALDQALTEFWAWVRGRTPCKLTPPGAQSPIEIDGAWHGKAKAAYWRVTLAEHHLKNAQVVEAAVEWRQLLGLAFPVPGETPLKSLPLFKK